MGVVDVAAVDYQRCVHGFFHLVPRGHAELSPLGDEHHGVGLVDGIVDVESTVDVVPAELDGIHCHWVVDAHMASCLQEHVDGGDCWRLAYVVGVGLERESPQRHRLALDVAAVVVAEFLKEPLLLVLVHLVDSLEHLHRVAILLAYVDQVVDVLGEQRAAISAAGIDVLRADAAVGAHSVTHGVDVGTHYLTQVGNLVHEAHPGGKHRGGGILYHLGSSRVGVNHGEILELDGMVKRVHRLARALVVHTQDDAVGLHEVLDGITLGQEVGVRNHVEVEVHLALVENALDELLDFLRRAQWNRRLDDKDSIVVDVLCKARGGVDHLREVGTAILCRWRVDGAEHIVHVVEDIREIAGEVEALRCHRALHHVFQALLIDWQAAIEQQVYLARVAVDACHVNTQIGKAGASNQPCVSCSNNKYIHNFETNIKVRHKNTLFI